MSINKLQTPLIYFVRDEISGFKRKKAWPEGHVQKLQKK